MKTTTTITCTFKTAAAWFTFIVFTNLYPCSFSQENEVDSNAAGNNIQSAGTTTHGGIDFFTSDEPLQMTLYFDIKEFIKTKNKPEYFSAILNVKFSDRDSFSQPVKIKARGEMRRNYCQFPPIMLKFKKSENDTGKPKSKGVTVKLVTHCMPNKVHEKYILKEYLTYRLFNQVTPYSFKVRLVHTKYVDINKPERAFSAFGFLIENEDQLAERNDAVIIDNPNLSQKHMNPADMARIAVFNYMIGNTDWSVPLQHNIRILKSLDVNSDKGIPVAYDFDYSGLVNAMYAIPFEELPITNVTERYYMGVCYRDEELKPILDEMGGLQDELLSTINHFEYLSDSDKKTIETYLGGFYKKYRVQNVLLNDLNRTCKQF